MDTEDEFTPERKLADTGEMPTVTAQTPRWHRASGLRERLGVSGTTLLAGATAAVVVTITAAAITVSLHTGPGTVFPDAPSVVSDPSSAAATVRNVPPGSRTWVNGRLIIPQTGRATRIAPQVSAPAGAAPVTSATVAAPRRTDSPTPPASAAATTSAPVPTSASPTPPVSAPATVTPPPPTAAEGSAS